jgi:hypothetical protein
MVVVSGWRGFPTCSGVLFRAVDYWLWGLAAGLTEDPLRCRRLVSVLDM